MEYYVEILSIRFCSSCVCVLRFSHYTSNKQIIRLILEEEEEDDDEENFFLLSSLCNATQRRQVRE